MDTRTTLELVGIDSSRRIATDPWKRPSQLTWSDPLLIWQTDSTVETRVSVSGQALISQFADLHLAPPRAVAKFAERYGPLHICDSHGLPKSHVSDATLASAVKDLGNSAGAEQEDIESALGIEQHSDPLTRYRRITETIDEWNHWSRGAYLALRLIAMATYSQRSDDPAGRLREFDEWSLPHRPEVQPLSTVPIDNNRSTIRNRELRSACSIIVDHWLTWGGVRQRLDWTQETPTFQLHGSTLFGAIAGGLAAIATSAGGEIVEWCSYCGRALSDRKRKTQPGRRACCKREDCQRKQGAAQKRKQRGRSK